MLTANSGHVQSWTEEFGWKVCASETASSTILSMLYNLMNEYNGLSGSLDEFSIVFRCFFSSSTSYFNALDVWINYGILTSPEIFVDCKKSTRWREGWCLAKIRMCLFFSSQ